MHIFAFLPYRLQNYFRKFKIFDEIFKLLNMFITFEARKTERNIYIFDLYFLPSKLQKVVLALRCANKLRRLCLFVFEKLRTSDFSNITYKSKQFFMIKKVFYLLIRFSETFIAQQNELFILWFFLCASLFDRSETFSFIFLLRRHFVRNTTRLGINAVLSGTSDFTTCHWSRVSNNDRCL